MNRTVHRLCSLSLAALAAVHSTVVLALPVGFIDLGTSTVDTNTGLEWLDLSESDISYVGPDYLPYLELESGLGLGAEGWRFASTFQFATLVENYLQIDFYETNENYTYNDSEFCTGSRSTCFSRSLEPVMKEFGSTFFGTLPTRWEEDPDDTAYFSGGYLIYDDEEWLDLFLTEDVSLAFGGFAFLSAIPSDEKTGEAWIGQDNSYNALGTYLVREYTVPEPSTLILLGLGLAGLGGMRRRKHSLR